MSSTWRAAGATAVRGLAELMLTTGALLAAFAFYLLVWTNVQTHYAQADHLEEFRAEQRQHPQGRTLEPRTGDGLNVLHIPRLGVDWEWVVVEGVDLETLNDGPGHFPGTALPGKVGNYAVAGHRATHGEPFAALDQLVEGDEVHVEAADGWYTYQVTWSRIIAPTQVDVVAPVPGQPGRRPTARTMTLVTCHPRWGSTERLVVGAQLVERRSPAAGPPDGLEV
ncbi:class E sortase [Nocardioides campestrisoli]|uniref:class E sortase n=1 Tax=Nocardioides campestrisoli TaxID=2736757 RepID=UPI00163D7618|nr:class E sortase [Nocardioides campestrisoli]